MTRPRGWTCCALWALLSISTAATAQTPTSVDTLRTGPPSVEVDPGMTVQRVFSAVTFVTHVDPDFARLQVGVLLGGRMMAQRTLTVDSSALVLDLVNGPLSVSGSVAVRWAPPGGRSTLLGDFVARDSTGEHPFRGDLLAWSSPTPMALERDTTWITPELRVETEVLYDTLQPLVVRMVAGSLTVQTLTLGQGVDSVVVNRAFVVGTVRIDAGMTLRMQPATPTQEGSLYLSGTFGSSNLPAVQFSSSVATWPYVRFP